MMASDLRQALRMLLKRPAFTLVAVLTLGLGIGANTAIFSVVNGVLLRPLPYPEPDRIVQIWELSSKGSHMHLSNPNFLDWRRAASFEPMVAYSASTETVLGGVEPVFAQAVVVSDGFFRVFGVEPRIGRTFTADEMREGGVPAVVVAHKFWTRTLGAETDLPRLRVMIGGQSARVVGVMPEGFAYPADADVWMPKELFSDDSGRTGHNFEVVARIKRGVSLPTASAELNTIAKQLKQQYGSDDDAVGAVVVRLQDELTHGSRDALLLLLGAVALVLLIACANVATTMLARGEERRTELAIRAALGATRGQLVRQLLLESLVLGIGGAIAGLLLAAWLVRALGAMSGIALPRQDGIGIDRSVLLFTLALAFLTPLVFGLLPSLQASRPDLRDALAEAGRGSAAPTRASVRGLLVAVEVAVALLLLVGAGLLIRSFANLLSVDPGFEPRGAVTASMAVPGTKYETAERAAQFYATLLERLRVLPGVSAAGAVNQLPLAGTDRTSGAFAFVGTSDPGAVVDTSYHDAPYAADYRVATPGYLEAIGTRLVQGRLLDEHDRPGQPEAAVVNQAFVRRYLPGTNPIGVRFKYAGMDPVNPVFTIVGVTADVRQASLVRSSVPEVYVCAYQAPTRAKYTMTMVVRAASATHVASLPNAVRDTIRRTEPDVAVEMSTLDQVLSKSVADRRFTLVLLGIFAVMALLLAATGVYSVLSQAVAKRTQEIGIRMALGAEPQRVVRLMLGSALTPLAAGIVAGAAGAMFGVRFLSTLLFGVSPLDPLAFAAATLVIAAVALVAGYIPARRATRVDPLLALRNG
jgi:putative ABC transport system permease protein